MITDIMFFGGNHNEKACYLFSPSSQLWTRFQNLPSNRFLHNSAAIGNFIFLLGGLNNSTIEQYEVSAKTFKNIAKLAKPRLMFGVCLFKNESLLIAGGKHDNDLNAVSSCFLFNTNTLQLTPLSNMNTKRCGHALVSLGDIIYCIGGWNDEDKWLDSIEEFNVNTEKWKTSKLKLCVARCFHQAVTHKHFVYIFSGACKQGLTSTIERFDTKTNCIVLFRTKLHVAKMMFSIAKVDGHVFIFGGNTNKEKDGCTTDSMEIFDLNSEQYIDNQEMLFPNFGFTVCVL